MGRLQAHAHAPTELSQKRCLLLFVKLEVASAAVGADSARHNQQ